MRAVRRFGARLHSSEVEDVFLKDQRNAGGIAVGGEMWLPYVSII